MDFENVKELIKIFDDSSLSRLKLGQGEFALTLEKATARDEVVTTVVPQKVVQESKEVVSSKPNETNDSNPSKSGDYINSPMVGTFYMAPSPGSEPFLKKGEMVKKGQTLCILEAMKIMNEIEAEFDCKIIDILVEDGQAIEYDMPLFLVEKI